LQSKVIYVRIPIEMYLRISSFILALLSLSSCTAPFRMAKPSPASSAVLEAVDAEQVLIVTADDFGRNRATNLGIIKGIEDGLVSCVTLMPVGSEVDQAYEYISRHPNLDIGIHLVLARDNIEPKWRPILPPEEIATLVDENGFFHTSLWPVLLQGDRMEIEKELEAQIQEVLARGIEPTFLSFHKGFFQMHDPKTFDVVLRLAAKHRLPLRRQAVFHDPSITESGILTTDKVVYDFGSYPSHEKKKKLLSTIDWLPKGITELVLHLAVEGEDEEHVRSRSLELRLITDPQIKEYLHRKGVRLMGYRELREVQRAMRAEEGGSGD
jgi:predicted glycoside hydrolase/deacetylase ChbG (UPF0249 family)